MQQLDTAPLDHPTVVLGESIGGRHRAPRSAARRVLTRIAVGAFALLAVAMVGLLTADAVGLTSAVITPGADFPGWSALPLEDEPNPARAGRMPATQSPVPPPAPDAGLAGGSTATVVEATDTARAPEATVEPPQAALVKVGDTCGSPGAAGETAKGKRVVCTARGGSARWKHA